MKNRKVNEKVKRSAKYDESYIQKLKANILIEYVIKKDMDLEKLGEIYLENVLFVEEKVFLHFS